MTANLTDLHREMLRVLLEKGGDKERVGYLSLAMRVKRAGSVLFDLETDDFVTCDGTFEDPRYQLTAAGVAEARKGSQ